MRLLFSVLFSSAFFTSSFSQNDINVMCYNVLNYTEGTSRADTIEKIFNYYTPDLLLLQELKTSNGLAEITSSLNSAGTGNYVSGTYVSQVSNPTSSWKLQQNIVYNTDIFGLAEERVVTTDYRDVNHFKLFLNNSTTADTVFLHVFVTHLKSSQGSANEQIRYEMAEVMRAEINALPANSFVLCGGDFNVYTSTETAYTHLIAAGVNNQLHDPINMPGNWHDSGFPNKEILTQSTRLNSLSDGAGGGLDDRFDFVLVSSELLQSDVSLSYSSGYKALGNNGTCYNLDLLDCATGNPVPSDIISALYYMSDHLPVVFSLQNDLTASNPETSFENHITLFPNPSNEIVSISATENNTYAFRILHSSGRVILSSSFVGNTELNVSEFERGMYFVELTNAAGTTSVLKFLVD